MSRVTPTEFAILGLLTEAPRSGYDIKKEVETRLAHFWSESYGHIYPMLGRLHEQGLVDRTVERQEGRPDRKVYSITDDGRRELRDWFAEPPTPPRPRNEILLRLFMGRHADTEYLLRDIRNYRDRVAESLAALRDIERRLETEADSHPDRLYWGLTLRYGLTVFEALVDWAETAEAELATRAGESDGS